MQTHFVIASPNVYNR